ncbi:MAG: hypothetical protein K5773_06130 [Pseudobutyrivibrio sp.]|nr:hypothetical protein [Pseudobutyrivibrio sp.]
MIDRKRLLSLGYYKKAASFTGSDRNKCYKIERVAVELSPEEIVNKFQATIWPGPFAFDKTADELKQSKQADFTEEGLVELVDWMNETKVD